MNFSVLENANRFDRPVNIMLICARFNHALVETLVKGALAVFKQHPNSAFFSIKQLTVPGVNEIPAALTQVSRTPCDGIWVGGVVIQGQTQHDQHIVKHCYQQIGILQTRYSLLIGNAILHVNNQADAWARCDDGQKINQGRCVAKALLEMIALSRLLSESALF